jgi:hypothetical protein
MEVSSCTGNFLVLLHQYECLSNGVCSLCVKENKYSLGEHCLQYSGVLKIQKEL